MSDERYDPRTEGAQLSFDGRMSHGGCPHWECVPGAQEPLSLPQLWKPRTEL